MSLAAPAALLLGLLAVPLVLLYVLKPRRVPVTIASHLLWRAAVQDAQAQSPWQRLRRNLLLLLELLLLASLVLALAVPLTPAAGAPGGDLVLVLDTSQSMAADDVAPSRIERAKQRAAEIADGLSQGRRVAVLAAGTSPEIVLAPTDEPSRVKPALARLGAPRGVADYSAAAQLAQAVAARLSSPAIVWLSDGGGAPVPPEPLAYPVRFEKVGLQTPNTAVTTLAVRTGPTGRQGWVSVANYGPARAVRLSIRVDGELVDGRDLQLEADSQTGVELNDVPPGRVVEARVDAGDAQRTDDAAWTVVDRVQPVRVLLAGSPSRFLEKALSLVDGVQLTVLQSGQQVPRGHDIYVLNGASSALPQEGNLFILGPADSPLIKVTGTERGLAVTSQQGSHPLLRYVDLTTISVAQAARMTLPGWMTAVAFSGDLPLLAAGEDSTRRLVALAFMPEQSDLPLQVAFPLLVDNAVRYLGPDAGPAGAPLATGDPIAVPAGGPYTLVLPGGRDVRLRGPSTFADTAVPGVYELRGADGRVLKRAAVNAGNRYESELRDSGLRPVQSEQAQTRPVPAATVQRWQPVALLALLVLLVEWAAYLRGRPSRRGAAA